MWRCIFATLIINNLLIFSSVSAETKAYVTVESCRILTTHIPRDDVNYKAGVDVRGRSVKPADLSPTADFGLKDKISFLLILDVAEENRGSGNSQQQFQDHPGLEGRINLGEIVIKDGNVTLDGKPLGSQNRQELSEFCQKSKFLQ
ncbi:MAG: hypothetical protein COB49_12360 [Alphaproteobacteria bacterium]|nr:MAG: hypothetical protein COB49_12360 [Alphaproteobacteria bacterium]